MPCDRCKRRFPLFGSLVLCATHSDGIATLGRLCGFSSRWRMVASRSHDGVATQQPTYASSGSQRQERPLPFCQHVHSLETVKAKGLPGSTRMRWSSPPTTTVHTKKSFRVPTDRRVAAVATARPPRHRTLGLPTVRRAGRGHPARERPHDPGERLRLHATSATSCARPTVAAASPSTPAPSASCHAEMLEAGLSSDYATRSRRYAAATLMQRRSRRATRGARLTMPRRARRQQRRTDVQMRPHLRRAKRSPRVPVRLPGSRTRCSGPGTLGWCSARTG